eukprot:scaffold19158_cov18-Tisochrysis_lutea.AAC.2
MDTGVVYTFWLGLVLGKEGQAFSKSSSTEALWASKIFAPIRPFGCTGAGADPHIARLRCLNSPEAGADPNIASLDGTTPLLAASEKGHEEVVHVLLACQANIGAFTQIKRTSLHLAG